MPTAIPTNRANARSCRVVAPSTCPPMNSNAPTGSSDVTEVLMDRHSTSFSDVLTSSAYVRRPGSPSPIELSLTRSKTTTVSYSEYPRMVNSAITVAGDTLNPTRAYTPIVIARSWARATIAAIAILNSSRNEM
jgi:hypothetical protein